MGLHIEYCSRFDVTKEEIESTEESQGKIFSFLKMMIELISLSLYCLYTVIFAYQLNQTDNCTNQDQICSWYWAVPGLAGFASRTLPLSNWLWRDCKTSARWSTDQTEGQSILEMDRELCCRWLHKGSSSGIRCACQYRFVARLLTLQAMIEKHAVLQSPSRVEELVKIFIHATKVRFLFFSKGIIKSMLRLYKLETGFWDMGTAKP